MLNHCLFALLVTITVLGPSIPVQAAGVNTLELRRQAKRDMQALLDSREGMHKAVDFARSRPELFQPQKSQNNRFLKRHEKMAVWSTWSTLLDHLAALDLLGKYYNTSFPLNGKPDQRVSFSMTYASFLAEYRYALEFIELVENNSSLDIVLNEEVPELGLPKGTYGRFKFRFLNALRATEFAALQIVDKGLSSKEEAPKLRKAIEEDSAEIWRMGRGKGHVLTFKNALSIVGKTGFAAWFPLQKNVAEWMGDIKVLHQGISFISEEQIRSLGPLLLPGDILLERREWYLSNLGLPGFWTHAALYVGSSEERRAFFDDAEVHDWVRTQGTADGQFETLLHTRYPSPYEMSEAVQQDGHLPRVLEAISEGVTFTTLEHSAAADSLAVIRPRLSKRDKAASLLRAFHYSGRPYDFNFDFLTDSSLVCSELVYKVYEPAPGFPGVSFPLDEIMGRKMATPNGMIRQFDEQYGTGQQQTDFVLFLDGYAKAGKAVVSAIGQLRRSWRRPKWHILIQDMPEELAKSNSSEREKTGTDDGRW